MLQVHAVGLPLRIVYLSHQTDSLARGLNLVACDNLRTLCTLVRRCLTCERLHVVDGDGFARTVLIDHIVPPYLVAFLGVLLVVLLDAHALAVDKKFHFVGIGVGDEVELLPRLTVPMVAHAVVACLDAVPHLVALLVDDGDMNHRLFGHEHGLHEEGLGLGFQRDVEHTLCPSFRGPSLALAKIVDGTPVSQTNHFVEIHGKEVLAHRCCGGFALVERHPREATAIAGEIHVTVVVGLNVGLQGEVAGQRVSLPIAVARVHGDGDEPRGVVAVNQRFHQFIHRHPKIVERLVGILLQLVAQAPQHDAGRVAVALNPFGHLVLPVFLKSGASARVLTCPFVVQFVNNQYAVAVAKFDELAAIRVMGSAYVVHAVLLHQLEALLDGSGKGGSPQCAQRVVVGITFQEHLAPVQFHAVVGTELHGAKAEMVAHLVGHGAIRAQQLNLHGVEARCVEVPQLRFLNHDFRQLRHLGAGRRGAALRMGGFVNHLSVGIHHFHGHAGLFLLSGKLDFSRNVDEAVLAGRDAEGMARDIKVARGDHEVHAAEQSATGVPA